MARVGTMAAMDATKTKNFTRSLTCWAWAASAVYVLVLAWLGWGKWGALQDKPLNELGDFLAGAFSPLAFLWLVVGYFQQGHELSASVAALEHQGNIFDAQRQDDAARFIAATTPKLIYAAGTFESHADIPIVWQFKATNVGGTPCTLATLKISDDLLELNYSQMAGIAVHRDSIVAIQWVADTIPRPLQFQIEVTYLQGSRGLRRDRVDLEFVIVEGILNLRVVPGSTHEIPRN